MTPGPKKPQHGFGSQKLRKTLPALHVEMQLKVATCNWQTTGKQAVHKDGTHTCIYI